MAKLEASNLAEYSPNQLKLLLRGIESVRVEEEHSVKSRMDMLNGEDLSKPFVMRQKAAIKIHNANLEDLLALKIAVSTNLQFVEKQNQILTT